MYSKFTYVCTTCEVMVLGGKLWRGCFPIVNEIVNDGLRSSYLQRG
jgi:hypothetical protein